MKNDVGSRIATQSSPELHEQHSVIKSLPKTHSKPPYRPLNLQAHEVTALEIVLEDYLKDRQSSTLSRVGDIHISKILSKVRRLK